MDRTNEFLALAGPQNGLPRPKRYSHMDDITSLRTKINKMKSHLLKYGHEYLNTYGCLPGASNMNDDWRDKLDHDVEEFINVCNERKEILKAETPQQIEYRETVIEIMTRTLNDFMSFYNQLRTTRMMRNMEKQKFDRVEVSRGHATPSKEFEALSLDELTTMIENDLTSATVNRPPQSEDQDHSMIAAEDVQLLAMENLRIHEELVTLDDEVKLIGKKVAQISRLQELFTEKVMEQEMDLNVLHEAAIRSSENVREGNELIRDAMMKNASTRVFILFYIITLGFTILFLDWYNP